MPGFNAKRLPSVCSVRLLRLRVIGVLVVIGRLERQSVWAHQGDGGRQPALEALFVASEGDLGGLARPDEGDVGISGEGLGLQLVVGHELEQGFNSLAT